MEAKRRNRNWVLPVLMAILVLLLLMDAVLIFARQKHETTQPVPTESMQTNTTEPETPAETEPVSIATLSPEELLYQEYIKTAPLTDCTYHDMDGDGLDELLGYCRGELDIVTIRDGKAESLLSDVLYSNGFFLCADNVIGQYGEGGGGSTYWFYRIENQQLQNLDCLIFLFNESAWYRSPDYTGSLDTIVPISDKERKAVAEQYAPLGLRAEDFMKPLLAGLEDIYS